MKFIRYSKFKGFDVFGVDLGNLMQSLSDSILDSGFHEDYWYTRERRQIDDSLDALREAILRALLEQGIIDPIDVEKMLAENEGRFKGSLLEELINQLIERMVEEGLLDLTAEERPQNAPGEAGPGTGEALPRDIRFKLTEKGLDFLGYKTLRDLLGSMGRASSGRHVTNDLDTGVEAALGARLYEFGDTINLDVNRTLLSAIRREGLGVPLNLEYGDLYVSQQDYQSSCATVVMLDCSHSMILYGEDRFTPAKKVTLALAHLIRTQYPGDTLDIVLFHDDAEILPLAKLATTQVGPYHTNTAEGLKLARRILAGKSKEMKQIVMVTDGKPTAVFVEPESPSYLTFQRFRGADGGGRMLYRNSMGNDPFVMAETFKEVQACRKSGIMINTFMLASDHYLVEFVKKMTSMTRGKAYFANPRNLSQFVLMDFMKRRTRRVR
ncbi:MAG: VWA domain-containing protein [Aridibacter famidurans]|nr:VWA domain-containing protein [Aridibacter famidurans]